MKTIIIHESVDDCVQIYIVEGNHRNLDDTFVGSTGDQKREDLLLDLIYGPDSPTPTPVHELHLEVRKMVVEEEDFIFISTGEL